MVVMTALSLDLSLLVYHLAVRDGQRRAEERRGKLIGQKEEKKIRSQGNGKGRERNEYS